MNNTTVHIEIDDVHRAWHFSTISVVMVWILTSNLMVIKTILHERRLQTLSNYVIASLAMTDLTLAVLVLPLAIYTLVNNDFWSLTRFTCIAWLGLDVFLSTASIIHLCSISINRYVAVAFPHYFAQSRPTWRRITCTVGPAWGIGVITALPLVILGLSYEDSIILVLQHGQSCGIFDRTFAAFSSIVSFFGPLAVKMVVEAKTIYLLKQKARRKRKRCLTGIVIEPIQATNLLLFSEMKPENAAPPQNDCLQLNGKYRKNTLKNTIVNKLHGKHGSGSESTTPSSSPDHEHTHSHFFKNNTIEILVERSSSIANNTLSNARSASFAGTARCLSPIPEEWRDRPESSSSRRHSECTCQARDEPSSSCSLVRALEQSIALRTAPLASIDEVDDFIEKDHSTQDNHKNEQCLDKHHETLEQSQSNNFPFMEFVADSLTNIPEEILSQADQSTATDISDVNIRHITEFFGISSDSLADSALLRCLSEKSTRSGSSRMNRTCSQNSENSYSKNKSQMSALKTDFSRKTSAAKNHPNKLSFYLEEDEDSTPEKKRPDTPRLSRDINRKRIHSKGQVLGNGPAHAWKDRRKTFTRLSVKRRNTGGKYRRKLMQKDKRAQQTLIIVFMFFLILWMPFFTTNFIYGVCSDCYIPEVLYKLFTWLGWTSSGINPCIYTIFNGDFRKALRKQFQRVPKFRRIGGTVRRRAWRQMATE